MVQLQTNLGERTFLTRESATDCQWKREAPGQMRALWSIWDSGFTSLGLRVHQVKKTLATRSRNMHAVVYRETEYLI